MVEDSNEGDMQPRQPRAKVLSSRAARLERYTEAAQRHAQHDPLARQRIQVQQAYATRLAGLERKQCTQCWLPTDLCACDGEAAEGTFPHTVIVYLHVKEFTKSSNTGCLLQVHLFLGIRSDGTIPLFPDASVIPDALAHSCSAPRRSSWWRASTNMNGSLMKY
jgi:hypothetical protein